MTFKPETILTVGTSNTGKTAMLVRVALANPNKPCWVFDNERKVARVADLYGGVPANMTVLESYDMQAMFDAMKDVVMPQAKAQPGGIVMFDMIEKVWEQSQEHFASAVNGSTLAEQMLSLRKENQNALNGGFEGFQGDWKTMKGWHNYVVEGALYRLPVHVFATAGAAALIPPVDDHGKPNPRGDDPAIYAMFREIGFKPQGEKRNVFRFNTVLVAAAIDTVIKTKAGTTKRKYLLGCVKDVRRQPALFPLTEIPLETVGDLELADPWLEFCSRAGVGIELP